MQSFDRPAGDSSSGNSTTSAGKHPFRCDSGDRLTPSFDVVTVSENAGLYVVAARATNRSTKLFAASANRIAVDESIICNFAVTDVSTININGHRWLNRVGETERSIGLSANYIRNRTSVKRSRCGKSWCVHFKYLLAFRVSICALCCRALLSTDWLRLQNRDPVRTCTKRSATTAPNTEYAMCARSYLAVIAFLVCTIHIEVIVTTILQFPSLPFAWRP